MTRSMKASLVIAIFLGGLPSLATTGCSSASSSESIPTIEGMSPGEYREKMQLEVQKNAAKSKRARRR